MVRGTDAVSLADWGGASLTLCTGSSVLQIVRSQGTRQCRQQQLPTLPASCTCYVQLPARRAKSHPRADGPPALRKRRSPSSSLTIVSSRMTACSSPTWAAAAGPSRRPPSSTHTRSAKRSRVSADTATRLSFCMEPRRRACAPGSAGSTPSSAHSAASVSSGGRPGGDPSGGRATGPPRCRRCGGCHASAKRPPSVAPGAESGKKRGSTPRLLGPLRARRARTRAWYVASTARCRRHTSADEGCERRDPTSPETAALPRGSAERASSLCRSAREGLACASSPSEGV